MTTFISSEALCNYKKDIWKMKNEKEREKEKKYPKSTYRHTCGTESHLRESTISETVSFGRTD